MEKQFLITPFASVGLIDFDTDRENVRKKLGAYTEFRKTKFSKNTTDNFGTFHVFYNTENKVDAVEFFLKSDVVYKGQHLFNLNEKEVISLFNDANLEKEDGSLNFISYGVEIAIEDGKITSILVHKKGY